LTFTEAAALTEQYRRREERQDRRAALVTMLLANVNRDTQFKQDAFTLEEVVAWLGHGFQKPPPPPPAPDELLARARALNTIYSASPNGALDP
jgi:hypothetical protein